MKTLDRYVLRSWVLIFSLTALGFPVVSLLINMTENLPRLLDRGLRFPQILLSYAYAMPAEVGQVMPALVHFGVQMP